jgi:hypothetical protein
MKLLRRMRTGKQKSNPKQRTYLMKIRMSHIFITERRELKITPRLITIITWRSGSKLPPWLGCWRFQFAHCDSVITMPPTQTEGEAFLWWWAGSTGGSKMEGVHSAAFPPSKPCRHRRWRRNQISGRISGRPLLNPVEMEGNRQAVGVLTFASLFLRDWIASLVFDR